jgi:hypothetical protein
MGITVMSSDDLEIIDESHAILVNGSSLADTSAELYAMA